MHELKLEDIDAVSGGLAFIPMIIIGVAAGYGSGYVCAKFDKWLSGI